MRGTWLSFRALQMGEAPPSRFSYGHMLDVKILSGSAYAEFDKYSTSSGTAFLLA